MTLESKRSGQHGPKAAPQEPPPGVTSGQRQVAAEGQRFAGGGLERPVLIPTEERMHLRLERFPVTIGLDPH